MLPKGLAKPAVRALHIAGYDSLESLNGVSYRDVIALHGIGTKGIETIEAALKERGYSLCYEETKDA
ncbi:hypothetical protein GCM10007425_27610 [Lysinibacillus alkalisoli]|uniref:DNA-binding protein n=1 Tax=Lysinibacillus alkalisoli TaxID=1911548 RepID=A0A917GA19_9BACI|nr:hypothetical protein [Lysinibacillus alkalisoli]GGG31475.1 hypothetical protein GCM10007425_27610 [Lysinibacillus alkalisoli]